MNTEYLPRKSLTRWVWSSGVNPRNTLVKSPALFKCGPSASLRPAKHQAGSTPDARMPSGSRTCLCPTAQDGAFWVKTLLFVLREAWDFPSSANSALGASPAQPTCSSREGTENPKSASTKVTHSVLLPQSHTVAFPADEGNTKIAVDVCGPLPRSLGKALLQRGFNLPHPLLQPLSDHRLSCTATLHQNRVPPSHPTYPQQLEEAPQTYQQEICPKSTSY